SLVLAVRIRRSGLVGRPRDAQSSATARRVSSRPRGAGSYAAIDGSASAAAIASAGDGRPAPGGVGSGMARIATPPPPLASRRRDNELIWGGQVRRRENMRPSIRGALVRPAHGPGAGLDSRFYDAKPGFNSLAKTLRRLVYFRSPPGAGDRHGRRERQQDVRS